MSNSHLTNNDSFIGKEHFSVGRGLTQAVLQSVSAAENARIRQVSEALIRHLHAFILDVAPSEEEWRVGIEFLTETGHMCSETRQEFILLSDVLGVSMLVDEINHKADSNLTESTVFGPFYVVPKSFPNGSNIAGYFEGVPLLLSGSVRNEKNEPIAGATVDIWHSDRTGFYDLQKLGERHEFAGRGRLTSQADGTFSAWTVRPTAYPIPDDGPVGKMLKAQGRHPFRPEHIHFMISAPGYDTLVTHLFASGDKFIDSDVVFGVKDSLICEYQTRKAGIAPDGSRLEEDWLHLDHDFILGSSI